MDCALHSKYLALVDDWLLEINKQLSRIKKQVAFRDLGEVPCAYLHSLFGEKFYALGLDGDGKSLVITSEMGLPCIPLTQIRYIPHLSIDHLISIMDQLHKIEAWKYQVFCIKNRITRELITFTLADLSMLWPSNELVYEHINEESYRLVSDNQLCAEERTYFEENFLWTEFFNVPGTPTVIHISDEVEVKATSLNPWATYFI